MGGLPQGRGLPHRDLPRRAPPRPRCPAPGARRRGPDGSGSPARALAALAALREAGADYNILCVVDGLTADNPDLVYDFFRRRDLEWLQFIPCVDPLGRPGEASLGPEAWAAFHKAIFDRWYEDLDSPRPSRNRYFDNLVRMVQGLPPDTCAMAGRCDPYPTIEADGAVYPCDFYVDEAWRLGTVGIDRFEDLMGSPRARRFRSLSEIEDPACGACFARPLCRGGCRRDREPFREGLPSPNRFCAGTRDFLGYAGPRLMDLARG